MDTWSTGGKNNNSFWAGRPFDVEAADRPLNPYVIPDEFFYAPPSPARLPGNDPARMQAAAPMFQDPSDRASLQRNWPVPNTSISGYDDVGTSYHTNMAWWSQTGLPLPLVGRFNEGARRIAVGEGAPPSRFVWHTDQYGDVLANMLNRNFTIINGYGDANFAPMLFLDGHVLYDHITPTILSTPRYTFRFEP